jgi:Beta-lactamase superfamily domain
VGFRLVLTGVGAMNSPRFAPAGLLVAHHRARVMIDGGRVNAPAGRFDAWLVTDDRAELIREIREVARRRSVEPRVAGFESGGLRITPRQVTHTSHDTYGYLIEAEDRRIAWAPEFWRFPGWASDVDVLFADAAGWDRPIRFAGGVGGHASTLDVAAEAQRRGVRRLVFAHIGRPTIRAMDSGLRPPFGEFGHDGTNFHPRRWRR